MKNLKSNFPGKPVTPVTLVTGGSLAVWLAELKARSITLSVLGGKPTLGAGATDHDRLMVERFEWALSRARLWPDWFAFIAGQRASPPPMDYFPYVPDRTSKDGKAFGCARCGWPADRIDQYGLGWCKDHRADMAFEVSLFEEAA